MYTIRNYHPKDAKNLEKICIKTASEIFQGKKISEEALVDVYCRYYIECEPESCFVVVDDADEAKGYILCAKDYDTYKQTFKEQYLNTLNPVTLIMGNFAMKSTRGYTKDYPAHLHIDLLPECQGQGYGRKLIETLIDHLKGSGIHGLMLHVSMENEGARAFYAKCGFKVLRQTKHDVLMGIEMI